MQQKKSPPKPESGNNHGPAADQSPLEVNPSKAGDGDAIPLHEERPLTAEWEQVAPVSVCIALKFSGLMKLVQIPDLSCCFLP